MRHPGKAYPERSRHAEQRLLHRRPARGAGLGGEPCEGGLSSQHSNCVGVERGAGSCGTRACYAACMRRAVADASKTASCAGGMITCSGLK